MKRTDQLAERAVASNDSDYVNAVAAGPDTALLEILACPQCHGELRALAGELACSGCDSRFRVDGGIPLLLPKTFDAAHLHEEESLARMMQDKEILPQMRFNLQQWAQSKVDFWHMVQSQVTGEAQRFVNVGCGFDLSFAPLSAAGHMFVNFELVVNMLRELQSRCPSAHYVNGDIHSLPFRPASFDYVISIDVIHHECDHLPEMFAALRRLLKPGGRLFLEDPNAWGLFQLPKSILMPRPLYRYLRSTYHRLRRSTHRPADYEFPTNVWRVKTLLKDAGFEQIRVYPQSAYPTISPTSHRIYSCFSGFEYVRTYHNYHYMLSAVAS